LDRNHAVSIRSVHRPYPDFTLLDTFGFAATASVTWPLPAPQGVELHRFGFIIAQRVKVPLFPRLLL
jgi:hypothetical protein